jgi:hypothetical protein
MKENRGVEATLRITTRDLGGGKDVVYKIPPQILQREAVLSYWRKFQLHNAKGTKFTFY